MASAGSGFATFWAEATAKREAAMIAVNCIVAVTIVVKMEKLKKAVVFSLKDVVAD
jgi:hypothetical protein